jgi:hypothetical protein
VRFRAPFTATKENITTERKTGGDSPAIIANEAKVKSVIKLHNSSLLGVVELVNI